MEINLKKKKKCEDTQCEQINENEVNKILGYSLKNTKRLSNILFDETESSKRHNGGIFNKPFFFPSA